MIKRLLAACIATLGVATAASAAYPDRPVTIVVPFPAGQTGDLIARAVGEQLSQRLGQSFIVDNKGGAGGRIGTAATARAKNDGYTLLLTSTGPFAIAPSLYANVNYEPLKDFVGIADIATTPQVIAVSNESGIKTFGELVQKAKSSDLSYASAGNGSTQHLTMEMLKKELDFPMVHIPFKGSAESKTQVMSGLIPATSDSLPAVLPQIRAGQIKPVAVVDTKRSEFIPDVPTLGEAGFRDLSTVAFFGLVGPVGMPQEAIETLNKHITEILAGEEMQKRFREMALTPAPKRTAQEYQQYLQQEVEKWARIIKESGVKLEN